MRHLCTAAIALLLACTTIARAAEFSGDGWFTKQGDGTNDGPPIIEARLTDRVYFQFWVAVADGEHTIDLTIYDGGGREVLNSQWTQVARRGRVGRPLSYGFDTLRDAPGTWWYVAAVDGKIVVSSSIQITR